jgi:hypothetical protein
VKPLRGVVKKAQKRKKSLIAWTLDGLRSHLGSGAVSRDHESLRCTDRMIRLPWPPRPGCLKTCLVTVFSWFSLTSSGYNGKIMARFTAWNQASYASTMLQWRFLTFTSDVLNVCKLMQFSIQQLSELFHCKLLQPSRSDVSYCAAPGKDWRPFSRWQTPTTNVGGLSLSSCFAEVASAINATLSVSAPFVFVKTPFTYYKHVLYV